MRTAFDLARLALFAALFFVFVPRRPAPRRIRVRRRPRC